MTHDNPNSNTVQTKPETTLELPAYPGIPFDNIFLVQTQIAADKAFAALIAADVVGFDTESKPIFFKGQQSDGPHLIQLATDTLVFLFPVLHVNKSEVAQAIIESRQILKVGFGLSDDHKRLQAKLGIVPENVLDLSRALRESKHRDMGAKSAVARFFGMKLQKSKKTSTSNWAAATLSERQMQYAADDAQVALLVYRKWLALKTNK